MTQWGNDHNDGSGDDKQQPPPDPAATPPEHSEPPSATPQQSEPWGPPATGGQPAGGDPWGQPAAPSQPPYGQPPQGQPQYGQPQPPYGEPQYGQPQPPYGEPQYGQPPYGQPQYGQPPYGQPQYGQPQYGQPQYGQPQYGEYYQAPGQYGQGYPAAPGYNTYGDPAAQNGWLNLPGLGTVQVASIGRRFLARLIDSVIFFVVALVLFAIAGTGLSTTTDPTTGQTTTTGLGGVIGTAFLVAAIGFFYEWLFIAFKGQTLGKMAMGVKVVRADDGQIPGLGKAFVRQIIPAASSALCSLLGLLMYISVFFDGTGRRQTWYDKAAGDFVISTKR